MTSEKTINLFYSYSHKDEALRDELEKHLKILKRQNVIDTWHDRKIESGTEWGQAIDESLEAADIILLLISADFLASDYCWDVEMQRAMRRHEEKSAVVIPVLLRPYDTDNADFMKLQGLPKNLEPVTKWADRDEAFTDIAKGIRAAAEEIRNAQLVPQAKLTTSPYPGLRAFTENESALFFGRKPEINALLDKIKASRFLAVIGASGSGKSSLVRAGLLPKLKEIAGGRRWEWLHFKPGGISGDPFVELSTALFRVLEMADFKSHEMPTQLRQRGSIDEMAKQYLAIRSSSDQLVIIIDQFEELFSLVASKDWDPFINLLEEAVKCPYLRIILTVRADFLEQCLNYPALTQLINSGNWNLSTPDRSALRLMIAEPAKAAGLQFEEGLIEQILNDTGTGSGALALMAFALNKLYKDCSPATTLTWEAYERLGRVSQAIGRHAEETYNKLDREAQNALGEVFAELVTVDLERGAATLKPVNLKRMPLSDAARQLIDAFTEARLLVKREIENIDSAIQASDQATVIEVAHEALLTHWDLLKNWINEYFDDLCLLRQVRMETAEWERRNRPEANLWSHERLQKVYDMQQKLKPQFSESVCAFIWPEGERLVEKLNNLALNHQQRERIDVRLAETGDQRPGIGVDENGLPQFEWRSVPPGRIVLEDNAGTFDVEAFFISKYPVTFRQYRAFLEAADGYHDPLWWTDFQHEPEPGEQYRKNDNHPAENVSWFDAMAFCRWLSNKMGFEIRLPTEWEWQQAATGGNQENIYPWGTAFESQHCNSIESGVGRTTAVGLYPQGISPVGALDMSGNVWEWCLNEYDTRKKIKSRVLRGGSWIGNVWKWCLNEYETRWVVRGGSWNSVQVYARVAYRDRYPQGFRRSSLGFRVVSSSPII